MACGSRIPRQLTNSTCALPRLSPPARSRLLSARTRMSGRRIPTDDHFATLSVRFGATMRTRQTWWRFRATSASSSRFWSGPATRAPRRSRSAAAQASPAASSPTSATATAALSVSTFGPAGVLEVDRVSGAARIAAGTLGPALEAQLKPHGLTLRHFPQSFEWSTLGGWIATRSGGHFATLHTHIDEFVEARSRRDAARRAADPAAAGLRRGPVRGAAVLRLRGHAWRDHRGVDARPGAAAVPRRRLGLLRRLRRRGGGGARGGAVRALPEQLSPARP